MSYTIRREFTTDRARIIFEFDAKSENGLFKDFPQLHNVGKFAYKHQEVPMSTVHIVIDGHPLCGFTADPPRLWPDHQMAVHPEEAHYCNCHICVSKMHDLDELHVHNGVDLGLRQL